MNYHTPNYLSHSSENAFIEYFAAKAALYVCLLITYHFFAADATSPTVAQSTIIIQFAEHSWVASALAAGLDLTYLLFSPTSLIGKVWRDAVERTIVVIY